MLMIRRPVCFQTTAKAENKPEKEVNIICQTVFEGKISEHKKQQTEG